MRLWSTFYTITDWNLIVVDIWLEDPVCLFLAIILYSLFSCVVWWVNILGDKVWLPCFCLTLYLTDVESISFCPQFLKQNPGERLVKCPHLGLLPEHSQGMSLIQMEIILLNDIYGFWKDCFACTSNGKLFRIFL